ncbi:MAG: DUF1273 family protein [Clostridia bacterium]|nr:DUF1273 family protein [Clostridia bacterium]
MEKEMPFEIEYACALTGHRTLTADFPREKLLRILLTLITQKKVTRFFCGMALGFDLTVCEMLLSLQADFPQIQVVACIPCPEQAAKFSEVNKRKYEGMVALCNEKIVLSPQYTPYCMHVRNRYMVEQAKYLLCYLRKTSGGTASTVNYAQKLGREIINL